MSLLAPLPTCSAVDKLFLSERAPGPSGFSFEPEVVRVFDDMVRRSVPGYERLQELAVGLSVRLAPVPRFLDLGCATGTTLVGLAEQATDTADIVGVDNSPQMLAECRLRLSKAAGGHRVELFERDLEVDDELPKGPFGAVIICLTLQFLAVERRVELLRRVRKVMEPGAVLILAEKVSHAGTVLASALIAEHEAFKASKGYSPVEIARKRAALTNRLIPRTPNENIQMLTRAGFTEVEIFFCELNFQGYAAIA
jgi:tRNA (cmo5U34)-methyltransferase